MRVWIALAAVVAALVLAPAAVAQDSVVDGYNNGGGGSQGQAQKGEGTSGGSETATAQSEEAGTLPFTGLDVGLVAAGGLVLIAAGAGMALLARPRSA